MQKLLFNKLTLIALISLLLLIPLHLIEAQITVRSQRQAEVVENIAQSSAGAQTLIGPVLALRYQQANETSEQVTRNDVVVVREPRRQITDHTIILPPQQLDIHGETQVETRKRGIYQGQLYHLALSLDGSIEIPPNIESSVAKPMLNPRLILALSVSDLRGVDNDPQLVVNGSPHRLQTGKATAGLESQIAGEIMYADLGPLPGAGSRNIKFSLPLSLTGTQRLAIAPVGENNNISLKSDWPHPNFGGRFLPRKHQIDSNGFNANWQISHLGRNFSHALQAGRDGSQKEALQIDLMDPVNIYLLSERAVKYGILFVCLTFGGFFIRETLSRSPIHPMQYLLVGLALAIFFLLLIALSEHFSFVWSYLISAVACIGLIGAYLSGAFGGLRQGMSFGAGLTGLYGVLFGILNSEDNSLLMGAILLFIALGGTMLGTRKLDWYRLGNQSQVGA